MRILIPFILISLTACTIHSPENISNAAEDNASRFAASMDIPVINIACSGADSDLDGYVSCTIKDNFTNMIAIECPYDQIRFTCLGPNIDCKMAMPKVYNRLD